MSILWVNIRITVVTWFIQRPFSTDVLLRIIFVYMTNNINLEIFCLISVVIWFICEPFHDLFLLLFSKQTVLYWWEKNKHRNCYFSFHFFLLVEENHNRKIYNTLDVLHWGFFSVHTSSSYIHHQALRHPTVHYLELYIVP